MTTAAFVVPIDHCEDHFFGSVTLDSDISSAIVQQSPAVVAMPLPGR
jgi:hypothetical protein